MKNTDRALKTGLVCDRGKKIINVKSKDPLLFEIQIVRSGQADRDDDRKMFVAMTSPQE